MTIAACFKFDEGILFCADTKITTDVKTNQTKIVATTYGRVGSNCATVFTFAGHLSYARAAITDCQRSISKLDFSAVLMDDIRKAIESSLVRFYKNHIYPNPHQIDIDLLIGVWLRGETRMFMTENAVVVPVNDYECIGAGAYLARYWVRQFFASEERGPHRKSPTMKDIALISAYALNSAMEYDESCGGEAEFLVMKTNGEIGSSVNAPIYPCDEFLAQLQTALWPMLRRLVCATDQMEAEEVVEGFVREIRRIAQKRGDRIERIADTLKSSLVDTFNVIPSPGGPLEAEMRNPNEVPEKQP